MTDPSLASGRGIPCAQWSRANSVDPIGTAGSYGGYVLVEWPLPWPRDAGEVEALGALRDAVAGRGVRVQLLAPHDSGTRRVALYTRPDGAFTQFEGSELRLADARDAADVRDAPDAEHVADEATHAPGAEHGASVGAALGRAVEQLLAGGGEPISGSDVLVCTHGRRDRCCGSLGTELWDRMRESDLSGSGARIARTSHTGGHRFAPTAVVLPAGTVWGFCDVDALDRIVRRAGPLGDLVPRYRGCSGLGSPAAQALERAVLAEVGWPLFDCAREVEELGGGRLRLRASDKSGGAADDAEWEATVLPGAPRPVPDCAQPIEQSKKTETEYRVEGLTRLR